MEQLIEFQEPVMEFSITRNANFQHQICVNLYYYIYISANDSLVVPREIPTTYYWKMFHGEYVGKCDYNKMVLMQFAIT